MAMPMPACNDDTFVRPPELEEAAWRASMARHRERLRPVVESHLARAARGEPHPVIDFLFQYYPFAPAHLMRWTPGWGVVLRGPPPEELAMLDEGGHDGSGWRLKAEAFPRHRRDALLWVISLHRHVAARPPRFGCFGLHEWAMVYRAERVRHQQMPLRYGREETARIVEALPITCSHYDAFRFFTPAARPLNRLQPAKDLRLQLEQRGCLHVNMDLYKWATQFYPWVSSDLIADCFLLALRIREVDMRASPYDVSAMGYTPIAIESESGRVEYVALQQGFAAQAEPLRARLIDELEGVARMLGD